LPQESSQPDGGHKPAAAHFPIPAFSPTTGGTRTVFLLADTFGKMQRYGPASRIYDIIGDRTDPSTGSPVQEVLLHPVAVFEHIREHQDGGYCYSGKPSCRFTNGGSKIPPMPNMVYCVYVNNAGRYFESGWEQEDPDKPGYPLGYQDRFKTTIWPKP
jgi:hypothetical protein